MTQVVAGILEGGKGAVNILRWKKGKASGVTCLEVVGLGKVQTGSLKTGHPVRLLRDTYLTSPGLSLAGHRSKIQGSCSLLIKFLVTLCHWFRDDFWACCIVTGQNSLTC